jgi:hypothetical protein
MIIYRDIEQSRNNLPEALKNLYKSEEEHKEHKVFKIINTQTNNNFF